MTQVFRNLLENALAACDDPARIEIECRRDKGFAGGGHRVERPPGKTTGHSHWLIVVRDNGPGMTAEQRNRAFEPFYTTKPRGTGLGMSIAQRIVEAHGGRIEIADSCGNGTSVHIYLPREDD
jgi:hypothetical protein